MRKPRNVSFKQLVIENKIYLINSKDEMEKIEKKIEDKQLNKPL
ncbi:FbpB family small basic protein [Pseudalkalibacillus decolorationis]|nr:FbpB family small basic protein [Pseudalkalibacillus decolorationis]